MGIIVLTVLGVGIFGNSFFLFLGNFTLLTGPKVRPMGVIPSQLFLANSLVLFQIGPFIGDNENHLVCSTPYFNVK